MLYQAYQVQSDLLSPMRMLAQWISSSFWLSGTEGTALRRVSAASEVFSRLKLTHARPPYEIDSVTVGEDTWPVTEETTLSTPFGRAIAPKLIAVRFPGLSPCSRYPSQRGGAWFGCWPSGGWSRA